MSNTRKLDQIKKQRRVTTLKNTNAQVRVYNRFIKQLDRLIAQVPEIDASASIVDNLSIIRHVIVSECVYTRGIRRAKAGAK